MCVRNDFGMIHTKTTTVESTARDGLGDKSYLPRESGDFPRIALRTGVEPAQELS